MTHSLALEIDGLHKAYGDHPVLRGIDLEAPTGSVVALLGPNGAGKTTLVNVASTLIGPDAGSVRVLGHDVVAEPERVREQIGMTGQYSALDGLFTGRENLQLMADLVHLSRAEGRTRVDELLGRFDLGDAADRPASTYSGGMRRRLDVAMTLLARPRLIFLDEPTTGLDPRSRRALWDLVREQVAEGVTVFLTTQYLDEADHLADRIAVLDDGQLVASGTSEELKRLVPGGHLEVRLGSAGDLATAASALGDEATVDPVTLTVTVPYDGRVSQVRSLLTRIEAVDVVTFGVHTPDLDDVFLALTGHAATTTATRTTTTSTTTTTDRQEATR
ncbi:ATP-binding cassette domain-containing protein [Nocardioides sp.]|uniref:ATP-binding cassette domain-containing protein n=1 Tax=Nocardioides sp. TaxID=35761 RepID=UPI002ED36DF4